MGMSRFRFIASSDSDFPAESPRLRFIPVTQPLAEDEAKGNSHLAHALSAEVPSSWPPEPVAPPVQDYITGWKNCYLTHAGSNGGRRIVVGIAGHKKWSPEHKTLQIGTALIPEYHGQRLGEEVVAALGKWGLNQSGIDRVICDVPDNHPGSAKSLERAGFIRAAEKPAATFTRFELKR